MTTSDSQSLAAGTNDEGVAMVIVLLMAAVLTALGLIVTQVGITNVANAGRDRAGLSALDTAEAGVSRAIGYINGSNAQTLACSPTCGTPDWGNSTVQHTVSLPEGRQAKVWIEVLQKYAPPSYKFGLYKIHSVGKAGPGLRTIEQTVKIRALGFPLGIFTHEKLSSSGTGNAIQISLLSDSCIDGRSHVNLSGTDAYYGIPAAAHSTQYVTDKNLSSCAVSPAAADALAIHKTNFCSPTYPFDQDGLGGTFTAGSPCRTAVGQYSSSSFFDLDMLKADPYNYLPRGLTDSQFASLRAQAEADGTFYTTNAPASWPVASTRPNPVLYFKIPAGSTVSIQGDLNSYGWVTDTACAQQHPSVVIVVEGGNLRLNSNANMSGAVFVPDGNLLYNGGATLTGTVFAKSLSLTGNATFTLNSCYASSTSGAVLDVTPVRFHEVDR